MDRLLVNNNYLLEKYPGKGGWTYCMIPEVMQDKKNPFGWVKVKGSIDSCVFNNYKLMPAGNGKLFLPIKAAIRKQIGKKEGDWAHIILFEDHSPTEIPEELATCLQVESKAWMNFVNFTDGEKKAYADWIFSAKTDSTKVKRINETIDRLLLKKKFHEH